MTSGKPEFCFGYGKTASNAVAAMSYLAEIYYGRKRAGSPEIADRRRISKPLVAKILTMLSQAGLVEGAPGPRGGYTLAMRPSQISLLDIVTVFEKGKDKCVCPYGPHWCGNNLPCPLHDGIIQMQEKIQDFLTGTTLAVFVKN